ncbi:MAG: hypothetical protein L0Y80_10675 [Ignavibacteriae bacterium]|nr:hypothetical protein [Ignavibacteriota bacterium]MCI0707933.1 hypothetical protein [Ignavibacteriota bacterium]
MEIIVEILLGLLGELFQMLIGELLAELGASSFKPQRETNRIVALIGCLFLGAFFGYLGLLIYPHRIVKEPILPGVSLVAVPVLAGLVMHYVGEWKKERGKQTSTIATFWGGAIFAFGSSLIRFLAMK